MRRVVITGMGIITALGCGVDINWKNLISSVSGIKIVDSFKVDDMPSKIAGEVSEKFIDRNFSDKDKRKMDKFILYSLIASEEAINNSGLIINNNIEIFLILDDRRELLDSGGFSSSTKESKSINCLHKKKGS